jgi:hypothetical protein
MIGRVPAVDRGGEDRGPAGAEPAGGGVPLVLQVAAFVLALAAYLYVIGWITNWARLSAARLPIDAVATIPAGRILGDGLRSTALTGAAFAVVSVVAYLTSARRWEVNGQDWHDIVQRHGVRAAREDSASQSVRRRREKAAERRLELRRQVALRRLGRTVSLGRRGAVAGTAGQPVGHAPARAPARTPAPRRPTTTAQIGETAVRILAGFNILTLSSILAAAASVGVDEFVTHAWWATIGCGAVVFLVAYWALTRWGPLRWGPYLQGGVWIVVATVALFASAPLAVVVLVSVAISTFGRAIARLNRPSSPAAWARSALPWVLLTIVALVGLAYQATPPITFPGAVITATTGAEQSGGYLAHSDGGVYLATCTQRSDATSTDERVAFMPSRDIKSVVLGGRAQIFDSGQRPSLATLALKALGLKNGAPTLIKADLRPRRAPCLGGAPGPPPASGEQSALGPGVIRGTAPAGGQAHDGEQPIDQRTPQSIIELARRYQPTVEVTAADRFWPVSVGAVLAERGPNGEPACLVQERAPKQVCEPSLSKLEAAGSVAGDYLQYPVHLRPSPSPELQFEAFERGQKITLGTADTWLANPRALNPWYTAQIYFYYAGVVDRSKWPKRTVPSGLPKQVETLEYWFYYPYNYFPLGVRSNLMEDSPLAAVRLNVDFHQGDWEHIDVLLDPESHVPLWLYLARHADEGRFVPWGSAPLILDQTHPVVQAAFGGHPTYPPSCGQQRRSKTANALSDWLVCGRRFVFAANHTPLVDIAWTPWACWRGHFGEAIPGVEVNNANKPESLLDKLTHQVWVAGPPSPLRQAENEGICDHDPRNPEWKAK